MTYIVKPKNHHPLLEKNKLGLTRRDYEGAVSTLCAGCGHDSVSSAIVEACFQLSIESYKAVSYTHLTLPTKA
mgnify:FL=1